MAAPDIKVLSSLIRDKANSVGFDLCGFAPSRPLAEHEPVLNTWCSSGMASDMTYLCRNLEKRLNPDLLFPGVRSVIVAGLNYYTKSKLEGNGIPVISRYAYGTNYHDVLKGKLEEILGLIKENAPGTEGKTFVDSAPLLEKAWAREAGLGWPGRHSVLINDRIGSFFFLGIILINRELDYDKPFGEDKCGRCRLCIEACPTGAINENRTIDTRKCIAYLTIESKTPIPSSLAPEMGGRVFGCDRCQEVCPWNKNASENRVEEFQINPEIAQMTPDEWRNLTREKYKRLFKRSAIGRKKYETFMENLINITLNNG
jgi:epoxyqueuosine reductase